ncbi:MAG: hypothetical protein WCJ01_11450, partial [Ignavibacteria bacterium]
CPRCHDTKIHPRCRGTQQLVNDSFLVMHNMRKIIVLKRDMGLIGCQKQRASNHLCRLVFLLESII